MLPKRYLSTKSIDFVLPIVDRIQWNVCNKFQQPVMYKVFICFECHAVCSWSLHDNYAHSNVLHSHLWFRITKLNVNFKWPFVRVHYFRNVWFLYSSSIQLWLQKHILNWNTSFFRLFKYQSEYLSTYYYPTMKNVCQVFIEIEFKINPQTKNEFFSLFLGRNWYWKPFDNQTSQTQIQITVNEAF